MDPFQNTVVLDAEVLPCATDDLSVIRGSVRTWECQIVRNLDGA